MRSIGELKAQLVHASSILGQSVVYNGVKKLVT